LGLLFLPVFVSVRAIALAVGRVIDHYKMAKHFTVTITDDALTFTRNAEQIAAEAALDGVYVLRTSLTPETLDAAATVNAYKLDLAVAVAAGVPCLRRFTVPRAGRVLLFAAEDALHIVRRRLEGISAAAGVALANLDIQVITAVERLDVDELADLMTLHPGEELGDGPVIGHARVLVADGGGEELQKPAGGVFAGGGDGGRHGDAAGRLDGRRAGPNRDELIHAVSVT